jgi:hypothetical protein
MSGPGRPARPSGARQRTSPADRIDDLFKHDAPSPAVAGRRPSNATTHARNGLSIGRDSTWPSCSTPIQRAPVPAFLDGPTSPNPLARGPFRRAAPEPAARFDLDPTRITCGDPMVEIPLLVGSVLVEPMTSPAGDRVRPGRVHEDGEMLVDVVRYDHPGPAAADHGRLRSWAIAGVFRHGDGRKSREQ